MFVKHHEFPNGDQLILEVVNTFVGLHGLTVFSVFYASGDGDEFQSVGSEPCMTEEEALAAFAKRVDAEDPSQPSRKHGGIHELVTEAFRRYLGDGLLRRSELPNDWAKFYAHVLDQTISPDGEYYDGTMVHEAIKNLDTTSSTLSGGRADVMLQLPAWKVLEMITAITALSMALHLQGKPHLRIAA